MSARSAESARRAVLMILVGALLALGGCGLPPETEPKYAGAAQSAAPPATVSNPDGPDVATTASALVTNFLQASVGANLANVDANDAPNQEVLDRLRKFMTAPMAGRWRPGGSLTVIRKALIKEEPEPSGNRFKVTVVIDQAGTLNKSGIFTPPQVAQDEREATFTVVSAGGVYRIEDMDATTIGQLLLSEAGFTRWYDWNPIYFWEQGAGGKLVPDMRYMPRTLSDVKRVGAVLDALKAAPNPLLGDVAKPLPGDYEFQGNAVVKPDSVQINLNAKAAGKDLSPLARQIRWSLAGHPVVTLTIEGQPNPADSERGFTSDNVTSLQTAGASSRQPDKFYVANGSVHAVSPGTPAGDTPLFLPGGQNSQVISAAIDRQFSRAALVRAVNPQAAVKAQQNLPTLWVSSTEMPPARPPAYKQTNVHGTKLSRPAWMSYPVRRLLVIADNRLWMGVDEKSEVLEEVKFDSPFPSTDIKAFAVAPDGHRIALISGDGAVMVASWKANDGGHFTIGTPQVISTLLGSNEGVDWLTETVLVVGGKPTPAPPFGEQPYSVVAITMDGAESVPLPLTTNDPTPPTVTALVALCGDPLDAATQSFSTPRVNVMVEVNNRALEVFRGVIDPLQIPLTSGSAEPVVPTTSFYPD